MDKIDDVVVLSATDLVAHLACGHVTWLDRLAASGEINKPNHNDPLLQLLQARGVDHERAYLDLLKAEGISVVSVDDDQSADDQSNAAGNTRPKALRAAGLLAREADTAQAMRDGTGVVYQATFLDQTVEPWWRGHADFLRRIEVPSQFGTWSYEPEDTKLSGHIKASAVLQLCFYAEQVGRLQGREPDQVHIVLGGNDRVSVRLVEVAAYYRAVKQQFLEALGDPVEQYPLPTGHCAVCRWAGRCHERWDRDDHLSRVAFITGDQTRKLEDAGIATLTSLANSADGVAVPGLARSVLDRLRIQARLQYERVEGEPPPVEPVLPIEPGIGLAGLPSPAEGDLFYDIEGHPYVGDAGLEYLHGIGWEETGEFRFEGWWAHTELAERRVFEHLIDFVVERRRTHPDLHVYHYAPYETTAIGKLMGRYGTREDEVDDLLRGGVFVDLYRVVRQGLRIGTPSYSIKKLEPLYMREREGDIGTGGSSVVEYERWLHEHEQQILDDIEAYNRDDVESTWLLRGWLEAQRVELIAAGHEVPRPYRPEDPPAEEIDPDLAVLIDRLSFDRDELLAAEVERVELVGEAEADDGLEDPALAEARVRWLMADLLQWHRREAKPEWWRFFARRDHYDEADFVNDSETLGRLELGVEIERIKQSTVWRYRFDPEQEFKLRVGDSLGDPSQLRLKAQGVEGVSGNAGTVHAIDVVAGTIDLRRTKKWTGTHPTALMPGQPMGTKAMKDSLLRVASALLDHGIDDPGMARSARQLLARRTPAVAGTAAGDPLRRSGEPTLDATVRLVRSLDAAYLPVQGPPGAGKTYTAARAILALVGDGHRVGITAFTHSAIRNLIKAVIEAADEATDTVRIGQKVTSDDQAYDHHSVAIYKKADGLAADVGSLDIVAGTSWQFSRDDMIGSVHTLVVDEAGQLSLANVVAMAPAATNLVLVGDPQQLSQPSKGTHPTGAGASALVHILGGEATVPAAMGVFLDQTWRMHPDVCAFISEQVYDGRLESQAHTPRQRVANGPLVGGAGLRWLPVDHEGNRTSSVEEAVELAKVHGALMGRDWTDEEGVKAPIGLDDVLVVAPYNAQVHELSLHLPQGARIGTVDKFQGQEAAVVLVSLAASSAEDVARGMEFLYSRNRLNVAVSRAKVLCVLAASPRLLSVECHTVEQMCLANMLCRYVEMAEQLPAPT
jgi:predicted RecB family nuclease